jgi:hypothetical protein
MRKINWKHVVASALISSAFLAVLGHCNIRLQAFPPYAGGAIWLVVCTMKMCKQISDKGLSEEGKTLLDEIGMVSFLVMAIGLIARHAPSFI